MKSKDIDGTSLKDDNASVHDEGHSESEEEEEEGDDISVGSSEGYETDNQSVEG